MKVLLFGVTGMIGQGVLHVCLQDPGVELVRAIGRSPSGVQHPNLRETVHKDLFNFGAIEGDLVGFDACFFCLGVSSNGMKEEDYERVTYGITLAAAETLARVEAATRPDTADDAKLTFIYISGAGADSTERGRVMWARVKGKTENALLRLPLQAYVFRPGIIRPLHGIQSRTRSYRILYSLMGWLIPVLRLLMPSQILDTDEIGIAMLRIARHGARKRVLEVSDIAAIARASEAG